MIPVLYYESSASIVNIIIIALILAPDGATGTDAKKLPCTCFSFHLWWCILSCMEI